MKNIHILPTDKPTKLHNKNGGLETAAVELYIEDFKGNKHNSFHIYITSDEEITEGEWYIDDSNMVRKSIMSDKEYWSTRQDYKKVILTTDQDLINDGVQAIDDEFLEWFVKNPSCEWVDVKYQYWKERNDVGKYTYKIIIPKAETKQDLPQLGTKEFNDLASAYFGGKPKQETLEEAAERFRSKNPGTMQGGNNTKILNAFKAGAEWQSDKMYSEGEVEKIAKELFFTMANCDKDIIHKESDFDKWFEKFKKK